MNKVISFLKVVGLLLLAISAVLAVLVVLIAVLVPDSITDLRVGSEALGSAVRSQAGTIVERARINPLLDIVILGGAYVFVCLISWSQDRLGSYLANRRHFS